MIVFLLLVFILLAIFVGLIVHETGHFIFAKIFKVSVKEFAIGIGPTLFSHQFKNTKFSWNLLPVMAFVRIDSEKSLRLFGELKDEYVKEKESFYQTNKARIENKNNGFFSKKDGKLVYESNWFIYRKYSKLEAKVNQYHVFSTRLPDSLIIDEIAKWKQLIIYFGGIFFNLILFAIFFLIQYFGLKYTQSPFTQVGESFLLVLKNMVFYNAWGAHKTPGTAFGSVADLSHHGGVTYASLPLIIVNYFAIFNLMLFFFNFIPIPPLDGYKIATTSFSGFSKIKISEKVKTYFEISGLLLMAYIFITAIIADFLV